MEEGETTILLLSNDQWWAQKVLGLNFWQLFIPQAFLYYLMESGTVV